jgi:hypothetical protein
MKNNIIQSKRFVIRKSSIGKNEVIEVTFKSGNKVKYNHDKVYEILKSNLTKLPCWEKYKSYTSSTNIPKILRDKKLV